MVAILRVWQGLDNWGGDGNIFKNCLRVGRLAGRGFSRDLFLLTATDRLALAAFEV
ncbi:MAG: hypothetical protein ACRERR_13530 [Moraxellaceae bacterium]